MYCFLCRIFLFLSLLFSFVFNSFSQGKTNTDSLELRLQRAVVDSEKVIMLNQLSERYRSQLPELSLKKATQALELSKKSGLKTHEINSTLNIGLAYSAMSDFSIALEYCLKALQKNDESGSKLIKSKILNNIGTIYFHKNDLFKALDYYQIALKLREEIGDKRLIAASMSNVALIYSYQKNLPRALEYAERSLKMQQEVGDVNSQGISMINIGLIYADLKQMDKAIATMQEAYKIFEQQNNKDDLASVCNNLGDFYLTTKNYTLASKYQLMAVNLARQLGDNTVLREAYYGLAKLAVAKEDFGSAYHYHELYSDIKDTLSNTAKEKLIVEMQTRFDTDKKEKENELLQSANDRQRIVLYSAFTGLILVLMLVGFIFRGYSQKKRANDALSGAYKQIEEKNRIVEEKNKDITDSIRYAKRIQEAILPPIEKQKEFLGEHFILFKPKDIVSGDFYWIEKWGNPVFVAAVDCTGHGVPGAFMSIVGHNLLTQAVNEHGLSKPALILNAVNKGLSKILHQSDETSSVKDGMDIALCGITSYDTFTVNGAVAKIEYAGAFNPLWIIRNKKLVEFKGDKFPVGAFVSGKTDLFKNHEIDLFKGDTCYIFTDGFADQFGGPHGKKFKYKQFLDLLISIQERQMAEQKRMLDQAIERWKGDLEQVDDILVIGFRV